MTKKIKEDRRRTTPLPPLAPLTEVIPAEAGYPSTPEAVGRRWAAFLNASDGLSSWAINRGKLPRDIGAFQRDAIDRLNAEGWRVWLNENGWVVKPPEDYELRRDYKEPEYSNEYMDAVIQAIDNAADEQGMIGDFGCIDFLTKLVEAADDADIKKAFEDVPEHVMAIINAVERSGS